MDVMKEMIENILNFLVNLTSDLSGFPTPKIPTIRANSSTDDHPQINNFTTNQRPVDQEADSLVESLCELLHLSKDQRVKTFAAINQIDLDACLAPSRNQALKTSVVSINNVTFTEDDMMAEEGHKMTLHVTTRIKGSEFKRSLIDTGASSNVITLKTLRTARVRPDKFTRQPTTMTDFDGNQTNTYGYVNLNISVGHIQSKVKFEVIEKEPEYHMILGRPWLHDNKIVPSTYHQCLKTTMNEEVVRIPASLSPYAPICGVELFEPKGNPQRLSNKVTSEGIKVDPTKTQAILTMPHPQTMKELQSFMGKVNYIRRFIPGLAQLIVAFTPLLKNGTSFIWSTKKQEAFQKIQQILSSPAVMKSPMQGRALCLYISSSDTAVGALLAQEDDEGIEHPIYYFSRTLRDVELRYPKAEKACLALVHAVQKFRHYLLSNKQAVADLLAAFPGEGTTALHEDLPGEFPEISFIEKEAWLLYFYGSSTPSNNIVGAGIVLVSPTGEVFSHSFKLDFQCTNNSAEYEAFLIGLSLAKQAGAIHLEVRGDSKLMVNQMNGVYSLKEVILDPYRSEAQKLLNYFSDVTITHIGHNNNKHADCLAILASKLQFEGLEETLIVRRWTIASTWLAESKDTKTDDWRTPIVQELNSSLSQGKVSLKTLQIFFMLHGVFYHRNPDGSLSRCLRDEEAQLQLNRIHNEICGQTLVVTLYRRLQRLGFYWPDMETQSRSLQGSFSNCQIPPHQLDVFNVNHTGDWREPYVNYFRDGVLPASKKDAAKMKQRAKRFVFHEGIMYRKSFGGDILRCLSEVEISILMRNARRRTPVKEKAISPNTREILLANHGRRSGDLTSLGRSTRHRQNSTSSQPQRSILPSGLNPFLYEVRKLLEEYAIKQVFSTIYYPQGNGQAESTNKTLIRILSRTVHDHPRTWHEQLPMALWAYRMAPRGSTGVFPYSLVYGADAILSAKIKIPSARIAAASRVRWNEAEASSSRIAELDILDSRRDKSEERTQTYKSRIFRAYDKAVKPRVFKVEDLVLKTARHIQKDMSASKFSPKWEGPYVITKAYNTGYYKIIKEDGGKLEAVINGKWLKAYYA
ncbi:uncharacterized protein LOC113295675 [Papaver somniferum]|uniref:uncharacterized protein LOC113295675 n=1 Tax=Papaver somniferum TaxID=3469 RepID=UPI000E704BB3|nr:uncharacterized protein LOC113295675 [Papaver somniferum]